MKPLARTSTTLLALLAMMALSVTSATAQELAPGGTFIDDDGTIFEPSIEALSRAGITDGCTAERYCPAAPVTRGQMASFLAASLDGLSTTGQDFFADDANSVHEADINLIAANDIARGYSDETFGPGDPVTRGQMASFLSRALDNLKEPEQDFFPDDAGSVHEADINRIAANDIAQGYADGEYRPEAQITRGEMAIMLVRAFGLDPIDPPARELPLAPIAAVNHEGQVVLLDAFTGLTTRVLLEDVAVDDPAANSISLAPDHETAFVAVPGDPSNPGHVVAVDTRTGDSQQIAEGSTPAVSPDGSTLAYVALEAGDGFPEPVIVIHDLEGMSEDRRLRGIDAQTTPVFIADLAWTPDGSRLAYVAGEIQTGAYLLNVEDANDLGDAMRLGPTAREEGSSWYDIAGFENGLAVAEQCCDVPSDRHVVLFLSLDPLTVEGALLPHVTGVSSLSAAGNSTLVYVGELGDDLAGTLYRWEADSNETSVIAEGFVVADG